MPAWPFSSRLLTGNCRVTDQRGQCFQLPTFSTEESGPEKSDFLKTHLHRASFLSALTVGTNTAIKDAYGSEQVQVEAMCIWMISPSKKKRNRENNSDNDV